MNNRLERLFETRAPNKTRELSNSLLFMTTLWLLFQVGFFNDDFFLSLSSAILFSAFTPISILHSFSIFCPLCPYCVINVCLFLCLCFRPSPRGVFCYPLRPEHKMHSSAFVQWIEIGGPTAAIFGHVLTCFTLASQQKLLTLQNTTWL